MASLSEVPPLSKIFVTDIWIETALWGINTGIFASVFCVLFRRSQVNKSHWVLAVTSLLLYLCATIHVSASLRQELEAFIYTPPSASLDYASLYFEQEGSTFAAMKNIVYVTAAFLQDLVLIWRMYVVWEHRWKIVMLPMSLIVLLAHIGCAYAAAILLTKPNTGIYSPIQSMLSLFGWPLELVLNICVAGAIIFRLWYTRRAVSRALSGTSESLGLLKGNTYIGPIFTIIESGAIIVAVSITMLVLYKRGNPAALMCLGIATQIAALVPYLIILRVGLSPNRFSQGGIEMTNQGSLDRGEIRFARNPLFESTSGISISWDSGVNYRGRESVDLSEVEVRMCSQGVA